MREITSRAAQAFIHSTRTDPAWAKLTPGEIKGKTHAAADVLGVDHATLYGAVVEQIAAGIEDRGRLAREITGHSERSSFGANDGGVDVKNGGGVLGFLTKAAVPSAVWSGEREAKALADIGVAQKTGWIFFKDTFFGGQLDAPKDILDASRRTALKAVFVHDDGHSMTEKYLDNPAALESFARGAGRRAGGFNDPDVV